MLTSRVARQAIPDVVAYNTGLLVGAFATGLLLWVVSGFFGPVPGSLRVIVLIGLAGLGAAHDFGLITLQPPENRRLVPERVFRHGWRQGALQFGFEMGTGVRTYVPSSSPYVLAAGLLLMAPGMTATLLAAIGFALGRAMVPWLRLLTRDQTGWDRRLGTLARTGRFVATLATLLVVVLLTYHELWT